MKKKSSFSKEELRVRAKVKKTLFFLVKNLEKDGAETVEIQGARSQQIGVKRVNPLEKLFKFGKITQQQFVAAELYQTNFELANMSNHARPTLIYEGLSHSSSSTKIAEITPEPAQIRAARKIFKIKANLSTSVNYEMKDTKWCCLKLPEILETVFEKEISIRNAEKVLGINHKDIVKRVSTICDILLLI